MSPIAERGLALAVATEQLAVADDAFGLRADVDEDLVLVDPDDVALDHVTVLEALDVGVLLGEQLLHRRGLRPELARRGDLFVVGRGGRVLGLGRVQAGDIGDGRIGAASSSAAASTDRGASVAASGSAIGASATASGAASGSATASGAASGSTASAGASTTASVAGAASVVGSSALGAGSSATAIAPTGSSDAWVLTEAVASVSGAVPPCCSSVNGLVTPVVDLLPRITNGPSVAQAVAETVGGGSVVIELRGPLLRVACA